ncbi:hypothetical protein, partial [Duganella callida]
MFKSQSGVRKWVAGAVLAMTAMAAASAQETVTVLEQLNGYVGSGGHSDEAAPLNNTFTGSENGARFNSWGAFFIPAGQYSKATLSLTPGSYGSLGPAVIEMFDVSAPLSTFDNNFNPGVAVFNDLGSGHSYGSATFYDQPLTLTLNANALTDINAASGAWFLIGFTNQTTNALPVFEGEGSGIYISGVGRGATQFQLDLTPAAAVPEPSQWLALSSGLLLLG